MKIRLASHLQYDSIVDGEGMRTVLWTQGCPHNCLGCHNPTTHSFDGGFISDTDDLINELSLNMKYQDGITLSGGDPFMQAEAVNIIASYVKSLGKNVWAFTGFDFEMLLSMSKNNNHILNLLNNIDVLVDGKFKIDEFSYDLYYRGSKNQRIIDVKKSLDTGRVVLIDKYINDKTYSNKFKKNECIFV